jgi:hypothetical protein
MAFSTQPIVVPVPVPTPPAVRGADGDFEFSISSEVLPDSIHVVDGQAIIWTDGQQIEWG